MARARKSPGKLYDDLGVAATASPDEIKRSYRSRAMLRAQLMLADYEFRFDAPEPSVSSTATFAFATVRAG